MISLRGTADAARVAASRVEEEILLTDRYYVSSYDGIASAGAIPTAVSGAYFRAVRARDALRTAATAGPVVDDALIAEAAAARRALYWANAAQMETGPHPWIWRAGGALGLAGILAAGFAVYKRLKRRKR